VIDCVPLLFQVISTALAQAAPGAAPNQLPSPIATPAPIGTAPLSATSRPNVAAPPNATSPPPHAATSPGVAPSSGTAPPPDASPGPLAGPVAEGPAAAPDGAFLDATAGRIYYEVRGEGDALILLHDGMIASPTWDAQFTRDAFPSRFRVVRYDRRGRGRSEEGRSTYSDVDDLSALMDALEIRRAVLVGCSSGGGLAIDFALAHPERVDALVLEGAAVSGLPFTDQFWERAAVNLRPALTDRDLHRSIELWVADPWLTDARNGAARERLRALLTADPSGLDLSSGRLRVPAAPALGRLAAIAVPTLIVAGVSDLPDVHALGGVLQAEIRGSKRVLVDGAAHLVHLERPDAYNALVLDFLRPGDVAGRLWSEHRANLEIDAAVLLAVYNAAAPLLIETTSRAEQGSVTVIDTSYAGARGGRVAAYLVLPRGRGPFPAVLFLHPEGGSRRSFLDDAIALAGRGVVSLAIDDPGGRQAESAFSPSRWDAAAARDERARRVADARRGLDLLAARPEVDPRRLVLVGHGSGSQAGAAVAALDSRVTAVVLMASSAAETAYWTRGDGPGPVLFRGVLAPEGQQAFLAAVEPFDAIRFLPRIAPRPLLLQFAARDEIVAAWDARLSTLAAGEGATVEWFDTGRALTDAARAAREAWLARVLASR
jgi:pimeloyl-ACP methyl ester carboxylesterase